MGMRFQDTDEESIVAEINITPLTDVFLVLLIIFMISSSAIMEGGLNVKLPSAKNAAPAQTSQAKPVFVSVTKDGRLSVNEKIIGDGDLGPALKAALEATSEKTVILRGDESIILGRAVQIMDMARNLGAEKIALATQHERK